MWWLYEFLLLIGLLCYLPEALWRRRLPHPGWQMRLGRYPAAVAQRLAGRSALWVHAVSVGEVQAVAPMLRALTEAYPEHPPVLSTITPGGFAVASKLLPEGGVIYFPLDLRFCVRRALDTLHPQVLLLVESELWPTVLRLAKARGIPVVVVNGRLSPRAFRRARRLRPWLAGMIGRVDRFVMQSQADADRLGQLGVPPSKITVVGSLKWEASLSQRPSPQAIHETAARIGVNDQETVLVGGSTHRGEETWLLEVFRAVRRSHPAVRLILAPRHLERVGEVEGLARQAGWRCARLSAPAAAPWDVGIVDAFGELHRYYGMATVVFIGGSLIPHGGQNPLEAAGLGKPILFGPFMHNFSEIAQQLTAARAARQLTDDTQLATACQELLADPAEALAMGRRAQALTERFQGATQRTLDALRPFLLQ